MELCRYGSETGTMSKEKESTFYSSLKWEFGEE